MANPPYNQGQNLPPGVTAQQYAQEQAAYNRGQSSQGLPIDSDPAPPTVQQPGGNYIGGSTPTLYNQYTPPTVVAPSPLASSPGGAFANPTNDTAGEDSFRNSYLAALKPSTAFTFNAQNTSTFGSNSNPISAQGRK